MKETTVVAVGAVPPVMTAGSDGQAQQAWTNCMADLLRCYPVLLPQQKGELLRFLTEGDRTAVGEIAQRPGLEPRLIASRRDHPEHFKVGIAGIAAVWAAGLLLLAASAWTVFE
jgi:hypothetical protein